MPAGPASSDAGVSVSIARDPALVRTVRLVAAAVARRTGRNEEFVEEVRLAAGEACALLLGDDRASTSGPVRMSIRIAEQLCLDVVSSQPVETVDPPDSDIDGLERWALLSGLSDSFTVARDRAGTTVSMAWPLS